MDRVLLVFAGTMQNGGIEKFIYNLVVFNTEKIVFDLILLNGKNNEYCDFILKNGGKIIEFNTKEKYKTRRKLIAEILDKGHYCAIHFHTDDFAVRFLLDLLKSGYRNIFSHSHNNKGNSGLIAHFFKSFIISLFSKRRFACSTSAGKWLFMFFRFDVVQNGIDLYKYRFNMEARQLIRLQYNVNDKKVIGCIGHFTKNHKNQTLLLELMREMPDDYCLFLIGDGEEMNNHKDFIRNNELESKVFLLGNRLDANKFYSAFDIYILPSFHEGSPYTCIEAVCSGLNVVVSDHVPVDKRLFDFFDIVKLGSPISAWKDAVTSNISYVRHDTISLLRTIGYSSDTSVSKLYKEYLTYAKME